jgi:transcriptional regulator with XRE-family HTH domain
MANDFGGVRGAVTKRKAKSPALPTATPPPVPPPEGLTQDEIARRVGCSQSTVWRAIAAGKITPLPNGRLPESAAETLGLLRKDEQETDRDNAEELRKLNRRLLEAQTAEREAKAELRALELERQAGRFISLDLVQQDGADTAERVLAVLRAIPQRTAMALECSCRRASVVEKKIREEVERAIAELRESKYIRSGAEGGT